MPNIQSAKKKLRQDIKRTKRNERQRQAIDRAVSALKKKGHTKDQARSAYSIIDKAAKNKVIHKNKAARLKSRVSRLLKLSK